MKPQTPLASTTHPKTLAVGPITTGAARLLLLLLLLFALPVAVRAQFSYTTDNGTITITGYTGPSGAVNIPSAIGGLPVTRIGDYAFAFYTSLTSVTIPDSVTRIGHFAFYGCTGLTSVTIGNRVTSIGAHAFYGCTSLSAITVETLNPAYSSVAGVLFDQSQTTLIQYPGGKAGSYTIPDSVTSIWEGAFYGCTRLTSVTIPKSVTIIGVYAFSYCTSLTSVTIPDSVTSLGFRAFLGCTSLTSVTIGNRVTSIGVAAFAYCTGLTSVTIGNSVRSIGDSAFQECTRLTAVFFQGNAPAVDPYVFGSGFGGDPTPTTIYHLPGTTGWGSTLAGRPTAFWSLPNPVILGNGSTGVQNNRFGFTISWATGQPVVVEACTDFANPVWTPVGTEPDSIGWTGRGSGWDKKDQAAGNENKTTDL